MPSDFDWILKRDPFWRELRKEEALAVRPSHPTEARETRTSLRRSIVATLVADTQTAETAGSNVEREGRGSDGSGDDQDASTANEP
jgi:hypothetical protein